MSAIELMDPKMDAGMIANQSQTKIKSFKQAVEENLIKIDNFSCEEKIAIVDNTLCNLVKTFNNLELVLSEFKNVVEDNMARRSLIGTNSVHQFIPARAESN